MLGVGGFPPPQPPPPCNPLSSVLTATPHNTISSSLLFPNRTHQTHLSLFSNASSIDSLFRVRTGFCVSALKKRRKGDNSSLLEMNDIDEDEPDGDDEEMFVPLGNMKRWLQNKPPGFGEGQVYDTSVEDKLFEEMEQSRQAQLANVNKLKNNPINPNSKKDPLQGQQAPEVVPSGIRVRVVNLPKKKNIHKDLQLAFKGVPGIINIIPAVSGNKKTRDPICKGFAFVDLKSEEDAKRFVQIFSRQSTTFGKIQKQIICEITSSSPISTHEQSADGTYTASQLTAPSLEGDLDAAFNMDNPSLDSWEETASVDSEDPNDELVSAKWEDIRQNLKTSSVSERNGGDSMESREESATDSLTPKQRKKTRAIKKKLVAKSKGEKVPKLNIPASANRLRIKEKAVLTGVFSKYGVKAASASKEQS